MGGTGSSACLDCGGSYENYLAIGWVGKHNHYPHIDLGIAAAHLTLAAEAEGLGSCMIGYFDEQKIKRLVGIPRRRRLPLIVTLGYPAKEKRSKKRKALEDIVSYDKYKG